MTLSEMRAEKGLKQILFDNEPPLRAGGAATVFSPLPGGDGTQDRPEAGPSRAPRPKRLDMRGRI